MTWRIASTTAFRGLIAGTCLPLLCNCAAAARPLQPLMPIDVPAAWSISNAAGGPRAGAAHGASADWWRQFGDPLLARLVDRGLVSNTSVSGAQAALRQAWALRDLAAAALWPVLAGTASAQHGSSGGHSTGNVFAAGANVNWVPDVFGGNRSAVDAAEAAANASGASLGDVKLQVAAELGLDYILHRAAGSRLAIAGENLQSQEETLQITRWRLQAGLVSVVEAQQAEAAVEQTRATLPLLRTSIDQSAHAIALLVGEPPAALNAELGSAGGVPKVEGDIPAGIPADTLRQRADVRAAEFQVAAAYARLRQADAARMPSFALGGTLGLSAVTLGSLTSGAAVLSTVIGSITVPVFDGGAARAQVRAQQAALDQAQQVYRATLLGALRDVEDALVALRDDRERLISLGKAAHAATEAASLARQRYAGGLIDFQTVLETQRTRLSSQDGVATATADVAGDHVRLYKALGGGWRIEGTASPPRAAVDMDSAIAASAVPRSRP